MKLNEAKFIEEIRRLASNITNSDKIEECHNVAGGIISICNILDTDSFSEPLKPQISVEDNFLNIKDDLFKNAVAEQHISQTRGDTIASEYDS